LGAFPATGRAAITPPSTLTTVYPAGRLAVAAAIGKSIDT